MDLRGPDYNTNAQVRDLERLVRQLQKRISPKDPTAEPRKRPQTAKQLNAEQTAQLIAGYHAGAKLRELGTQFGIHPDTASLILRREGVAMRPKGLSPELQRESARLYAEGMSLKRVGERLSVDGETVRQVLIRLGIRLRDRHGRQHRATTQPGC